MSYLRYISTGITWNGEKINGIKHPRSIKDTWTEGELAAIDLEKVEIESVVDPAPINSSECSFDEFMDLLTSQERDDLMTATLSDLVTKEYYDRWKARNFEDLTSTFVDEFMDELVLDGVLSQARADAIQATTFPRG